MPKKAQPNTTQTTKRAVSKELPLPEPSKKALRTWNGNRYAAQFFGADWSHAAVNATRSDHPENDGVCVFDLFDDDIELARRLMNDWRADIDRGPAAYEVMDAQQIREHISKKLGWDYGFRLSWPGSRMVVKLTTLKSYPDPLENRLRLKKGAICHGELFYAVDGIERAHWNLHDPRYVAAVKPIYVDAVHRFMLPLLRAKAKAS